MNYGGHCCACSRVCHHVGGPWYCPQHDPYKVTVPATVVLTGTSTAPLVPRLCEEDIERIAQRVAELLRAAGSVQENTQ